MAREGKKLELYEILAAKRAKGKQLPGFEPKAGKQANSPEPEAESQERGASVDKGIIIDDAINPEYLASQGLAGQAKEEAPKREAPPLPQAPRRRTERATSVRVAPPPPPPEPEPEPRPRSPREVVFALDTAFVFFAVILALVGSSYFLGYKRGQEEKPAGLAGVGELEVQDRDSLSLRNLAPAPRSTLRPSEQDYTLVLRTEPASDDLPERLELELAEAVAKGKQKGAGNIPSFIFKTGGNDPRYILAVGLGASANDAELTRLQLQIYNPMEGITLSREPRPYIGCRIAPVRELGTPVY